MSSNQYILMTIFLAGLVTWVPRVVPFVLSKKLDFPKPLKQFLSYLPMSILMALFIQNLLIQQEQGLPLLHQENILASIPTILVGVFTKDLMWTVVVGIISMAVLRFFM